MCMYVLSFVGNKLLEPGFNCSIVPAKPIPNVGEVLNLIELFILEKVQVSHIGLDIKLDGSS